MENKPIKQLSNSDLLIRSDLKWIKLSCEDIMVIESADKYVKIFTTTRVKPYLVLFSLCQAEKIIPRQYFCRVHRRYIVSVLHVRYIGRDVVNLGERDVPLSKMHVHDLYGYFMMVGLKGCD